MKNKGKDTIVCLLDNNAILDFSNKEKLDSLCNVLDQRHNNGELVLLFSPISFYELIYGIKSQSDFKRARANIRTVYRLSQSGHMLPDPETHLKATLGTISLTDATEKSINWTDTYSHLSRCKDYSEFHNVWNEYLANFQKRLREIVDGYGNVVSHLRRLPIKELNRLLDANTMRNDSIILNGIIRHFKLEPRVLHYSVEEIFNKLPSLRYYLAVSLELYRKWIDGRVPRNSDYFDLEQLIYLDVCDYLITSDRRLRNSANRCESGELIGRLVSTKDFLDRLASFNYRKTAPLRAHWIKI